MKSIEIVIFLEILRENVSEIFNTKDREMILITPTFFCVKLKQRFLGKIASTMPKHVPKHRAHPPSSENLIFLSVVSFPFTTTRGERKPVNPESMPYPRRLELVGSRGRAGPPPRCVKSERGCIDGVKRFCDPVFRDFASRAQHGMIR